MDEKYSTDAMVVAVQEAHVLLGFADEASAILWKMGWKAVFARATPGEGGNACGGTMVAVRA